MNGALFPRTSIGKWSIILIGLFLAMYVPFLLLDNFDTTFHSTLWSDNAANMLRLSYMTTFFVLGLGAFVTGWWAILKQKEYAVLVFFAAVLGSGLFILLVMELLGIIE
ncbi:hypothetical protein EVJ33_03370 [Exiguobacterium sp. SL-10]|jgi:hypothetical protein|uniref:hypothetical protein n=1 Tax=unclassified Exiguobacterium TaxID=2644629 RepID=UPI00103D2B57|nr:MULTISPECIES: hypothetical protein [unclassified Exiguobacterium]TCI21139.1 hypothetical protein EVJ34_11985 [Exiguobacterium sp. SL-9]TCI31103.1 hypothetical protein EVJ33_03370 [Exiguobacterium sp. SL-10]